LLIGGFAAPFPLDADTAILGAMGIIEDINGGGALYAGMFDTHAHLSYLAERGIDADACVSALFGAGFAGIIDIGTAADDLPARLAAFSRFSRVRFAAGCWPWKTAVAGRHEALALLEKTAAEAGGALAAIGECGFDRRENPQASDEERELFDGQMTLARKLGVPLIVHSRDAAKDTLDALEWLDGAPAVIHCFSYGMEEALAFVRLGCHISFAGNLTFKNAGALRDAIRVVPPDRLLLETDCPFLAPVPHRGQPAHPGMVAETYRIASDVLGVPLDDLKPIIRRNAELLFFSK
jgi:TatD DNase family protein